MATLTFWHRCFKNLLSFLSLFFLGKWTVYGKAGKGHKIWTDQVRMKSKPILESLESIFLDNTKKKPNYPFQSDYTASNQNIKNSMFTLFHFFGFFWRIEWKKWVQGNDWSQENYFVLVYVISHHCMKFQGWRSSFHFRI